MASIGSAGACVLLEEVLSWVRALPGSQRLRGLIVFDEVYGFLPPHPSNPPTKRPLVALMKQARAFGVGVVVATQNPMDLDYRALSNAGLWCIGRLQTDADRARVIESLASTAAGDSEALADTLKRLAPRWFLTRNTHASESTTLLQPRWTMSFMRGPMTRAEIQTARKSMSACRYLINAIRSKPRNVRKVELGADRASARRRKVGTLLRWRQRSQRSRRRSVDALLTFSAWQQQRPP